jgi:glycosyltransferase involved in cell wall biosynthesis
MTGSGAMVQPRRPQFTIVTAVYDVEPYLPDFIDSIERLRVPAGDLEVVAVDDGSTDGSLDRLREWGGRSRHRIRIYTKPNGGQGSARNLGLEHATGEWVTFTDPDDMLDRDYFRVAARFAEAHPSIDVLATRPILLVEGKGLEDSHPRRRQFQRGDRVADLDEEPNVFPGSASVTLYRLDRIARSSLRFDERVRPNFEDGHFAVRYLLGLDAMRVGLLAGARYIYRKRSSGTSTLQRSLKDPGRYTNVLEFGYLGILDEARDRLGQVPPWLQQVLIYELSWYLAEDEKITSGAYIAPEVLPRFHELLAGILRQLDPDAVASHRVRTLHSAWLDLLAHGGRDTAWHGSYAVRTKTDRVDGLQRLEYRFVGPGPEEAFELDAVPVRPAYAKTRAHRYYGADLLFERVLWLPAGAGLQLRLDGVETPLRSSWPPPASRRKRRSWPQRLWAARRRPIGRLLAVSRRASGALRRRVAGTALQFAAGLPPWRRRFAGAWLLMDRIHDADDNGERLFEHLRRERPDINAWFALDRASPDWDRLAAAGDHHLLAHGSFTWRMAMLNCAWLLSSHADLPIVKPPQLARTGRTRRQFGFLQHGVIKDDLSRWLNLREPDLFVVSTEAELASIADDGTPYRFCHKETRNTGLPRFDRLLAVGGAVPETERNLVIVAPTWRQWLTQPLQRGSQRRTIDSAFRDSEYMQSWLAILRSPAIAEAVARRGWRFGFMPHPNLQGILGELDLPAHVEALAFAGTDVQALYGQCALLVTDYSSVVFNTAYLDRPAVYFQFDREEVLRGGHVGRQGYFDYERDGFGPVAHDVPGAERAIVAAIDRGASPTRKYQSRIDRTFTARDGKCCARVVAAIEELSRPYTPGVA